jgi:DNA primase
MVDGESGRVASHEERWLHEANAEAAIFYRQELLQTTAAWPVALLKDWCVEEALDPGSGWQIGYAPDSSTRAIDHLQKKGFGRETLMRAGLMSWTSDGRVVDRYRDQLVVVSRDQRLDPVGFVGIGRDGEARPITPQTPVHRPSEALVGVLEQIDLLEAGATAVIVDHPLDAIAIDLSARYSKGKGYVGIPLFGSAVSDAQAQTLRQYSATDRVIVTVLPDHVAAERAVRNALDLSLVFERVRVLQRPPEPLLANLGELELLADILVAPPANSPKDIGNQHYSLGIEDPGPSL